MIAQQIAGSDLMTFPESSHHAHWEERERYVNAVREFQERH